VLTQSDSFDKRQIRKMVVDQFSIQRLITEFEDILSKQD
jgi:hypothetical protein